MSIKPEILRAAMPWRGVQLWLLPLVLAVPASVLGANKELV